MDDNDSCSNTVYTRDLSQSRAAVVVMSCRLIVLVFSLFLATNCNEVYDYEADTFEIERGLDVCYNNDYYHRDDDDDDRAVIVNLILQTNNFDGRCSQEVGLTAQCRDAIKGVDVVDHFVRHKRDIMSEDIALYNASLQILCTDCLDKFNNYYQCIGEEGRIEPLARAICTLERDSAQYCPTVFLKMMHTSSIDTNYCCNVSEDIDESSCHGDCIDYLADIRDYLGCCAGSLFGTTVNIFSATYFTSADFSVCDVTLDDVCDEAVMSSGVRVDRVSVCLMSFVVFIAVLLLLM